MKLFFTLLFSVALVLPGLSQLSPVLLGTSPTGVGGDTARQGFTKVNANDAFILAYSQAVSNFFATNTPARIAASGVNETNFINSVSNFFVTYIETNSPSGGVWSNTYPIRQITNSYTATTNDKVLVINATAGPVEIQLPKAVAGLPLILKCFYFDNTYGVTAVTNGADTAGLEQADVDGKYYFSTTDGSLFLVGNPAGDGWNVVTSSQGSILAPLPSLTVSNMVVTILNGVLQNLITTNLPVPNAAGGLTNAHGFSTTPAFIRVTLLCTNDSSGYVVGDEIDIFGTHTSNGEVAFTVSANPTDIVISQTDHTVISIIDRVGGGTDNIYSTRINWNLKLYARQF